MAAVINGKKGEEVDITDALKHQDRASKLNREISGQLKNLLETHGLSILKVLKRDREISIGFQAKVRMMGNLECLIGTDITYVVEKVKDGLDATLKFNQDDLPFQS